MTNSIFHSHKLKLVVVLLLLFTLLIGSPGSFAVKAADDVEEKAPLVQADNKGGFWGDTLGAIKDFLFSDAVVDEDSEGGGIVGSFAEVKSTIANIFESIKKIASIITKIATGTIVIDALTTGLSVLVIKTAVDSITFTWGYLDTMDILLEEPMLEGILFIFNSIGTMLFFCGFIYSVAEISINYRQNGNLGDSLQDVIVNYIKAFFALLLYHTIPIPLYILTGHIATDINDALIASIDISVLEDIYDGSMVDPHLFVIFGIVFLFAGIKVLLSTIKRSGTMLVLLTVGSLHMLNIPRGRWDAFWSWARQVIAICFTNLLQLILLTCGVALACNAVSKSDIAGYLLGCGVMLSAAEVPRIADRFGMDTSLKGSAMSVANTAVTTIQTFVK